MDQRNFQFLYMGLTAAWLIVFVYIVVLVQRGRKLQQEIGRVRKMLEEREGK